MIELALLNPDIPHNTGALMRFSACVGVKLHIIEPCGFILNDRNLQRVGMDYIDIASYQSHIDFDNFLDYVKSNSKRLILATTKSSDDYLDISYMAGDIILMGSESKGAPNHVHKIVDQRVSIKMCHNARSLNLSMSAAIIVSEALRQLKGMQ